MPTINWATKIIFVPQSELTFISTGKYGLDINTFRLALKDLEDSEDGIIYPTTHIHNTEVSLSGVTYARVIQIINGYTITFEDVGVPYTIIVSGANHNIADVKNINNVSLIIGNSAGLISVQTDGALEAPSADEIASAVWNASSSSHTNEGTMGSLISLSNTNINTLLDIQAGNWEIIETMMIFYKRDGSELFRFSLLDQNGLPNNQNVFKRLKL